MTDGAPRKRPGGRASLPVNLLVKGWPCLVVGGGPVAHRKAAGLLAAGAAVRVVSPKLGPDLAALAAAGRVAHTARRFAPADAAGMRVVFAATDDPGVNRQVLDAARAAGALCCCVDGNWPAGDFVTPAVLHTDGLTVAVSTGGRSCRQARMVKDTLGRHLRSIETADLLILGTSHEELPLERREAVHLVGARLKKAGDMLMQVWGIHEFMLLITCNRVELAVIASASAGQDDLLERALGFDRLEPGDWYRLTGADAFAHMALVTAGMRSQSPGEYHVAAQVKAALQTATDHGWAHGMMQAWIAEALHISKHVKNEVTPLLPPAEIEDMALDYIAESRGGDWRGRTALVLGAGALGRDLVGKILQRHGRCDWCYHVKRPVADPAWGDRVKIVPMKSLSAALGRSEIVFCAAKAAGPLLHEAHAPCLGPDRPVLIVDLGVPRNVSPALVPLLPRAELVNLDRLKARAARRNGGLDRFLAMSRAIVEQHRSGYDALIAQFQGRNKGE